MEKSSEVYRRNNNGPKTLPCGTPDTTLTSLLKHYSQVQFRPVKSNIGTLLSGTVQTCVVNYWNSGAVLKVSLDLGIFSVIFDAKMTFEKNHLLLPLQFPKESLAWYCPGEYFMISRRPGEMLSGFCPASFAVLFCGVVLGCRVSSYAIGPCSQWR